VSSRSLARQTVAARGQARRVLDARTDSEAIRRALRKVVDDAEIEKALDSLLREGRFRAVYR
jgi:hypothetical protein